NCDERDRVNTSDQKKAVRYSEDRPEWSAKLTDLGSSIGRLSKCCKTFGVVYPAICTRAVYSFYERFRTSSRQQWFAPGKPLPQRLKTYSDSQLSAT
ncbi:MAG TPA: hypothetical protein VF735_21495, partial [Pyrinomonadaceae bacterium]